ncbi:ParB/RepB/Spo0J family partition protein [Variovorax atrisoli]|uniref:ParB/RepB/Spo0J family partition protein n=1 Tax=Variovorax atrisoli TaxID=3394203 RepID=UPI00036D1B00|nr:ParB/RepB/Spo0J family partition protein [Variovorax paradoxus]
MTAVATSTLVHCPGCEKDLPRDAYNKNASRPNGLQRYCRTCQLGQKASWDDRNREKKQQYDRDRRAGKTQPAKVTSTELQKLQGLDPASAVESKAITVTKAEAAGKSTAIAPVEPVEPELVQNGGFAHLQRSALVPSLTNPRTHFDHDFLADLAESIRKHGVAQPLLVRPLPGARLAETYTDRRRDAPRPTHEIVAGEQRWRASEMAGLRFLPVLIRDLSDAEVLQLQLIENLKRRDLHPMEEAEGYERLRQTTGMTPEEIAAEIGKGRTYVYKTMKLLDLVSEAREAFYAGKLTRSTAELVAFRPAHLQPAVLKDFSADFHGEPMSYRKAKDIVDQRYMLRLGSAPFKITDETLVAAAGSCRTCPKRTGANPDLFDDVAHADTCTDPQCFSEKKEAHYARVTAEAEARGQTVIVGKAAKEIMPNGTTLRGYTKVDDHQAIGGQMKTLRKVLGKDMPATTLVEDPQTHEMVEMLPTAVVGQLLKEQGLEKPKTVATSEAEAQRRGIEQFEKEWRRAAVEKIDEALQEDYAGGISAPVVRLLAHMIVDGLGTEERQHVCALLKLGKVAPREAIESHIDTCPEGEVERVLMLLLVQHDMRTLVAGAKAAPAARIEAVAKDFEVDVAGIKSGIKAAMKKAASEAKVESAAAAVNTQSAPAPAKPARKPKLSKEEATATIAAQLQQAENPNAFKPGDRVRLKADLRKGSNVIHTRGVEAEVLQPVGDRAWLVQPDTVSFSLSADYTEMESIES